MPEEVRLCPLCGYDRSTLFDRREHLGRLVCNRLCSRCGLIFQSPRMTAAEAEAHYAAEYRRTIQGREGPTAKDLDFQRQRAARLVDFLRRKVRRLERCLDIGCSSGLLLQRLRETYAAQATGVEPGEAYRAYARECGLEVHASLDEVEADGRRFDLISLIHVLEHLPDPVAYLTRLRERLLAADGWLLVEVPNVYIHTSFEYEHLYSFSRRTLTETLRKAGFRLAAVRLQGRPISQCFPFYITVLARPLAGPPRPFRLRPERGAARKRLLGTIFQIFVTQRFPKRWWLLIDIDSYQDPTKV
ncbi:MAG: class I SAM-dependent methyltransferase [Anaerolineales bacterium]